MLSSTYTLFRIVTKSSLSLLFTILSFTTFSQSKQANTWYFGDKAGLDFNNAIFPPVPLINGQMNTAEGCASISDINGQLLFYTDGTRVWDKTHILMPNANGTVYPADWDRMLSGDQSSSQSAVITPVIGSPNKYYLFTTDGGTANNSSGPKGEWDGLYYTVVNMSLNNGLGDIDTAFVRNMGYSGNKIPLTDSIGEKITVAIHKNKVDYWIITRKALKSAFHVYRVTCNGVDMNPVISSGYNNISPIGPLVASFDGRAVVNLIEISGSTYSNVLYDFDNISGRISNPQLLSSVVGGGVAFSPNDSIIYITSTMSPPTIERYLRYSTNPVLTKVIDTFSTYIYTLETAPDGRIYMTTSSSDSLSVLHTPNNFFDPGVDLNRVPLGGKLASVGLPNFFNLYTSNRKLSFVQSDTSICLNQNKKIGNDSSWSWTFSWEPTIALDNSNISNPTASPDTTTTYIVTISLPCTTYYDTITITVNPPAFVNLGQDTSICLDDSIQFTVNGGIDYLWSTGDSSASITIDTMNTYWILITDSNGCKNSDTIRVNEFIDNVNSNIIASDTLVCNGTTIDLTASGGLSYLWLMPTNQTNPFIQSSPIVSTNYTVIVKGICDFQDTASIQIEVAPCNLFIPNAFSPNNDGENDFFRVRGEGLTNYYIRIYDRWGNQVFEANDINKKWLGTVNNAGVYVYVITGKFFDGNEISSKGNITLIR